MKMKRKRAVTGIVEKADISRPNAGGTGFQAQHPKNRNFKNREPCGRHQIVNP